MASWLHMHRGVEDPAGDSESPPFSRYSNKETTKWDEEVAKPSPKTSAHYQIALRLLTRRRCVVTSGQARFSLPAKGVWWRSHVMNRKPWLLIFAA